MQIHPRLSRSRSRICSRRNSALKDRAGSSPTIKTEPVEKVPDSIASSVIEPAIQMPAKMPPVAVKESLAVTPRPASAVPVTKEKPSTKKATPGRPASTPANMVVDKAERASKEPKTEPGLKLRNPKHRAIEPEPLIVVKQEMKMEVDAEEPELAPEPAIPLSKEKKKRVVPPVQKKDVPVVKGGNVDCLANTRQKRVIKERSKTIVDSIKARNKSSAVAEKEVPKKVTMAKTKVKEEASVTTEALKKEDAAGPSSIDVKMKGRKRKEKSEVFDEHFELMTLPPCKTISLGDKVKVYYAPNREGKITSYEAKVISTEEENGETLYFVHYIGWNARYDEWIRADRIADNVSWIAGRSSKKATQTPTPKSAKKAKNTITSEIKTEAKASCSKEGVSTSSAHSSSKDHHGNWQGSVGRSTTPSSIAPSHVRSEGAVQKRPKTRATFSKKDDEVAEDVGSEAEDSKHAIVPLLERECTSSRQSKTKKTAAGSKDESALTSVEVKEEKYEESDEEEVDDGECEGMDLIDPKSEPEPIPSSKNDPTNAVKEEEVVEVKAEVDDVDEEDDDCYEKVEEGYEDDDDEDDPELLIQNSIVKGEYSDVSLGRGTPLLGSDAPTADSGSKDNTFHSVEEFPAGKSRRETDSDAGGVSAVEEISLTEVENEIKEEDGDDENNKEYDEGDLELLIQNSIVEEEYSDDSLGRGMTFLGFDAPTADSGSKDNTFHSVEEFPAGKSRRETDSDAGGVSAVEEISLTEVENEIKEEDGDDENNKEYDEGDLELLIQNSIVEEEYSDDSLGRGMTFLGFDAPTADSGSNDNTSQFLADKSRRETNSDAGGITAAEEISLTEVKNKITCQSPSELLSKDGSSPESTPTIQTCEEAFGTICWSPLRAATLDCRHIGLLENIALLRFQHRPESHEDDDSEDQLVIYERDSYNSNAICDTTAMEFIEESDIKTGPEDESQPETSVMDACPDAAQPDDSPAIKVEPVKEVDSGEAAVVEEDEDNLESLICEETIPSSPPSQVDSLCQMEKKRLAIEEEDDMFKNEPQLSSGAREAADTKNLVQVVRVNRCPSTTLESNESSRPSPPRECSETTRIQNERKTDEVKTDATTSGEPSFKKNTGKGPTDGRSKKVEAKTPAKRGRKAKKKFENAATTRKTYSKHVKNQGSEIVDGIYDGSGSSGRGDSSSGTPHPYRRNFLIPQDKLITMDVAQRITTIAQAMQDLRMTYRSHKTELAAIDKLRKRTRRC